MNEFLTNLKKQVSEQPLVALGSLAAVASAMSKLMNTRTQQKKAKSWDKEVNRRVKKSK